MTKKTNLPASVIQKAKVLTNRSFWEGQANLIQCFDIMQEVCPHSSWLSRRHTSLKTTPSSHLT